MLFSKSTGGFYSPDIHGEAIPDDAVEVTEQEYAALMDGQATGKVIVADSDGRPILATPTLTPEEIQNQKVALVQKYMDDAARALRYDSIANAITYADEPSVPKFQAEGRAFRAWRSLVWDTCYRILDQVKAGEREIPTDDELLAELPDLSLPELGT
ncbi:hypothetical protein CBR67_03675 [Bordetella hinzii]|uniref:hypothetical protein n=1 Tax=Bordetella hinzii TaxID=103855 RepID=UPI00114FD4F3|nr:hypothetical protein [Bordetella hinzii]QDJ35821.1 hypothetical protein CBR67_03675 [Bordetella hinzii]